MQISLQDVSNSKSIENIQFGVWSSEEISKYSAVEVTSTRLYLTENKDCIESLKHSVYDPMMGALNKNIKCFNPKCGGDIFDCPGHFGHIELPVPVLNPLFIQKYIYKLLDCVCCECGESLVSPEIFDFNKLSSDTIERLNELAKMKKDGCRCLICDTVQPSYQLREYRIYKKFGHQEVHVTAEQIEKIFICISDKTLRLYNIDPHYSRPEWMVIRQLPVCPPCVRQYQKSGGHISHDDLTIMYIEIIKIILNFTATKNITDVEKQSLIINLEFRIRTLFDNTKTTNQAKHLSNGKPMKGIKDRLKGKEGRFRQNLMGKRVNQCARSVIGGEVNMRIDQLGVPRQVAQTLSYPETVNDWNINWIRELLKQNKLKTHTRNGHTRDINMLKKLGKCIMLQVGDIVEREMLDNDVVVFNRQPTLHRGGMMGFRAKILPPNVNTFKLTLAVTQPFNAD